MPSSVISHDELDSVLVTQTRSRDEEPTMSESRPPTLLRVVFLVHGLITLAGAVVLTVWPAVIPATVGITLERSDFLVVYLVGAAELAAAVLSFGAARLTDRGALWLIVLTFVVLHGFSGILDIAYMAVTHVNGAMIANTVARFAVVTVFLVAWRATGRHHT
jgi:hypothetical protein